MPTIAFATCEDLADLDADERHVLPILSKMDIRVQPAIWNDPSVSWNDFDLIVLRSCWDYDEDPLGFFAWLSAMEKLSTPVLNPPYVARWNVDKTHLRELAENGVALPPTAWIPQGANTRLSEAMQELDCDKVVIKPTISLGAHGTWRSSSSTAAKDESRWRSQVARTNLMVQRFQPEIMSGGEWSLVFIGGEYSHACLKLPAPGDFRVQTAYGGSRSLATPDPQLVTTARKILTRTPGPHLYARVDGVIVDDELLLMEVELVDPQLYLAQYPAAAVRFAECLKQALSS